MKLFVLRVLVLITTFGGIGTTLRVAEAVDCNNQCRHRRDHCYNEDSKWRCWHWVTDSSCYYCVGANNTCTLNRDAMAGPCAVVTGQTNEYEIYDGCTMICTLNVGAKGQGTCSGTKVGGDTVSLSRCQGGPVADQNPD